MNASVSSPSRGPGLFGLAGRVPTTTMSGYPMPFLLVLDIAALIYGIMAMPETPGGGAVTVIGAAILFVFLISGFYLLASIRRRRSSFSAATREPTAPPSLRWTLPWLSRKKISVRIHNVTSDTTEVNDLRGNPIEVATNVVWRVSDTARALFDVEDYQEFVDIQIESAVRARRFALSL